MVVAEVLTGISLVKASVDFIKSNINTANDISQIARQIDDLFKGEKQIQKERNRKNSKTSISQQFGVESVAQEVIDAKLAEEKLQEMRTLVDMRFGPGTWQSILDLRSKRIQEEKEARRLAAIARRKEQEEMWEQLKIGAIVIGAIIFGIFAIWFAVSGAL